MNPNRRGISFRTHPFGFWAPLFPSPPPPPTTDGDLDRLVLTFIWVSHQQQEANLVLTQTMLPPSPHKTHKSANLDQSLPPSHQAAFICCRFLPPTKKRQDRSAFIAAFPPTINGFVPFSPPPTPAELECSRSSLKRVFPPLLAIWETKVGPTREKWTFEGQTERTHFLSRLILQFFPLRGGQRRKGQKWRKQDKPKLLLLFRPAVFTCGDSRQVK